MTEFLSPGQAMGHQIYLQRMHPRHLSGSAGEPEAPEKGTGFSKLLIDSLNTVNDRQLENAAISQRMVVDPESVDIHDVTIAMAKANMTLSITKSVVDRVIQAYRQIINIR